MNARNDNRGEDVTLFGVVVALTLWVALIAFKMAGIVTMQWALVLSGILWISWGMAAIVAMFAGALRMIERMKRWQRRRKVDKRIKRQAQMLGMWDKPQAIGGRALEIYAWEWCGIKRQRGETDAELRRRCMATGLKHDERKGGRRK